MCEALEQAVNSVSNGGHSTGIEFLYVCVCVCVSLCVCVCVCMLSRIGMRVHELVQHLI